jgi:hypothetical protein
MRRENLKSMKSKKSGITLIALIITIIVLLILAGVTISALIGENGILSQAKNASDGTKNSSVQEAIELAWAGRATAYYEGKANGSNLTKANYFSEEEMSKELLEGKISDYSYEEADTTFVYTINSTGEKYGVSIDKGGKVSISEVYIKINNSDGETKVIIPSNVGKYLGMKVSAESYNANDATYRLFYIDFNNDYKDGEGTIYLKADYVESKSLTTSETYNAAYVQKFNIGYTAITPDGEKNTAVSWLLNSSNWTDYCDAAKGAIAAYGAPSLEMWVKSYNQFLNAHSGLKNANSEEAKTLAYNFSQYGYYVGVKEGVDSTGKDTSANFATGEYALVNKTNNSGNTQVQAQIGMYNPGLDMSYWLASPWGGTPLGTDVLLVWGEYSSVAGDWSSWDLGISALVSLQSGVTLELVNE